MDCLDVRKTYLKPIVKVPLCFPLLLYCMFEYSVTPKNRSGNIVEEYSLFINGTEVVEEPVEIESGKHTIRLESKGLQDLKREIEINEDKNQVIRMKPSEEIFVAPSQETLENVTNEQLARAVETSSQLVEVDKVSTDYVEFYSSEAEVAKLEILEDKNGDTSHDYKYVANVIVDMDSKYRYNTTDIDEKGIFSNQFSSPLRAVREIEDRIYEEMDSIF